MSLSARRAWIEIFLSMGLDGRFKSLSARRAWIEMSIVIVILRKTNVALRKESVDRNFPGTNTILSITAVALRKESVDRNIFVYGFGREV